MTVYPVKNLSKINKQFYKDGDIFYTKNSTAILINNKMETLLKKSDVEKMIEKVVKENEKV